VLADHPLTEYGDFLSLTVDLSMLIKPEKVA